MVILHGGDIYSSGNDLSKFLTAGDPEVMMKMADEGVNKVLHELMVVMINLEKPLIGVVNGSCYGIAFTMLSLADFVYCTKDATFCAPFIKSFQSPEGTSILSFPQIFGARKAAEILFLDKLVTAKEAFEYGFVTQILNEKPNNGDDLDYNKIPCYQKLLNSDLKTIVNMKKMMAIGKDKERFEKIARIELDALFKKWTDPDFLPNMMTYMQSLSQKKPDGPKL